MLTTADRKIDELQPGVDPDLVGERMYPYLERTVGMALDQCETFIIEGFECLPRHLAALVARLEDVSIRACFLGHVAYSHDDLASYQGQHRWHESLREDERRGLPEWIRRWSDWLRTECAEVGQPYIDVGELGFHDAMAAAERSLFPQPNGRNGPR